MILLEVKESKRFIKILFIFPIPNNKKQHLGGYFLVFLWYKNNLYEYKDTNPFCSLVIECI
jgi:hypothetical protein